MARINLSLPVVGNAEAPAEDVARHGFNVGERLFPESRNPTGLVMDALSRRSK